MSAPMQLKTKYMGVEDINQCNKPDPETSKYSVFLQQDVDYRYHQEYWNHQIYNQMKQVTETYDHHEPYQEKGTLPYIKDYIEAGVLFQTNQQDNIQKQPESQCHQNDIKGSNESQNLENTLNSRERSQEGTMSELATSGKQNRSGKSPKAAVETSTNKKCKCQCEICFKEFGHKSNLFIHMRTHNGERPYKCSQCDKSFTHSGNLAIHMRTHSGERPYGCQVCGKMFSHSGNLSTHLRTHSGVKPYKCHVCSKEFRHSGNLSIHERIHSGIKPFQCKICGKEFYHSGNLTTHMKKHSANMDMNSIECENSDKPILSVSSELSNSISPQTINNVAVTSNVKQIPNGNNVPIKSESKPSQAFANVAEVLTLEKVKFYQTT